MLRGQAALLHGLSFSLSGAASAKTFPHFVFAPSFLDKEEENGKLFDFSQPRSLVVAPPVNRAGETDARRRAVKNCVFWPPSSAPLPAGKAAGAGGIQTGGGGVEVVVANLGQ